MALKTYVLLDHTKSSAHIYRQVNPHQRQRLDKRQVDHAFLQIAFQDRTGKRKVIRLRLSQTDEIDMQEQKKLGIDANVKHTWNDKRAVEFKWSVLTTGNLTVQKFLETSPQFEDNWIPDAEGRTYVCEEIDQPLYKLLDETKDILGRSKEFKQRVQAANRISDLSLREAQELIIKLFGSFAVPPKVSGEKTEEVALAECQNALVDYIDDLDAAGLTEFLTDREDTVDEKVTVLIGKAIQAKILAFDDVPNEVTMYKGGAKIKIFMVPDEYGVEERLRQFADFLVTEKGKTYFDELSKLLATTEKKGKPQQKLEMT